MTANPHCSNCFGTGQAVGYDDRDNLAWEPCTCLPIYCDAPVNCTCAYCQPKTEKEPNVMSKVLIALALLASLTASPVIAKEAQSTRASIIRNAGTDDAAVRLSNGQYVQAEYISFHMKHRNDSGYRLYEDGSAVVVSDDGCYQDTISGRKALRDC